MNSQVMREKLGTRYQELIKTLDQLEEFMNTNYGVGIKNICAPGKEEPRLFYRWGIAYHLHKMGFKSPVIAWCIDRDRVTVIHIKKVIAVLTVIKDAKWMPIYKALNEHFGYEKS